MESKEMKLRDGATDSGRIYEYKMVALLAFRMAFDETVKDFWIVSNIDGVGAFDDVVIVKEDVSGCQSMFCIQLKHLENRKVELKNLEGSVKKYKGTDTKFSLEKYQSSYQTIKENLNKDFKDITIDNTYLVLYTNANLSGKGTSVIAKPTEAFNFLDTSAGYKYAAESESTTKHKPTIFKIANSPASTSPFDEDFLARFYFYTSQAKADSMDGLMKREICSHFQDIGNAEIVNISDYFAKWAKGRKGNILKLCKRDIEMKLLELLLYPHIMNPYVYIQKNSQTIQLLNTTLLEFNVTCLTEKNLVNYVLGMLKLILEQLYEIELDASFSWDMNLTQKQLDKLFSITDVKKKHTIINDLKLRQHFVPHLTLKDLYWSAFICKCAPLTVDCEFFEKKITGALEKFANVSKDCSFVLYNPTTLIINQNLAIFNNFTNLVNLELLEKNMENLYLSFNGKQAISMTTFMRYRNLLLQITPHVYLQLLCESVTAGENYEMENYYVKRKIVRPKIKSNVFHSTNIAREKTRSKNSKGDLFIVLTENDLLPLWYENKSLFWCDNIYMNLDKYVEKILIDDQDMQKIFILTTNYKFSDKMIYTAKCLFETTNKNVHILAFFNENLLEWLHSEGSIEILEENVINSYSDSLSPCTFPEDQLTNYLQRRVNVISDNAGMGKTSILTSIANKYQPDEWVIFINLSDHDSELTRSATYADVVQYIFETQSKSPSLHNFLCVIFAICLHHSKLIFLFDGYDEVASLDILTVLLATKQNYTTRFWVTTRPQSKFEIESLLETFSLELLPFDNTDQKTFLTSYFQYKSQIYNYSDEQIESAIGKIQMHSMHLDKTLAGVPLQSRMFAEILGDDMNKLSENENFTVIDLYNEFIDIKLKEYKHYEAVSLRRTLSKLALKFVFLEDCIKDLIDLDELQEDAVAFDHSYKKDSIVTGINQNGDAMFAHRTFTEFLIAQTLAQKITSENISNHSKKLWMGLIEKMFCKELQPIRLFFDRILSKNLILHTLVLSNESKKIANYLENNKQCVGEVDCFGRSALHLAVSHGKYYDIYNVRNITGIRKMGMHPSILEKNGNFQFNLPMSKTNQVDVDVIEILLKYDFLNNKETLFKFDIFDYALKACSLKSLNLLYKKFPKDDLNLSEEFDLRLFLYCVICLNLPDILCVINNFKLNSSQSSLRKIFEENKHLFKNKYNDYYLLEHAASYNAIDVIVIMFKWELIQITDGYPIHRACFNGHVETLQLLFDKGADVNGYDKDAVSPVLLSGVQGRSDITSRLLKNPSYTSQNSVFFTPLHYACQSNHLTCTSRLIQLGADVNKLDYVGQPPIYYAALYGYAEIIKELTKQKHNNGTYEKALEVVVYNNDPECIKYLYEAGVDINAKLTEGKTALMLASINGSSLAVKFLASLKNCDIDMLNIQENLKSMVMWAAQNKHFNLTTKLVELTAGAKGEGGVSALLYAVMHGHVDVIRILLDAGADYHMKDGITGLQYPILVLAALFGKHEVIKMLLDFHHDPNDIELAIVFSSLTGNSICLSYLLEGYQPPDPDIKYEASEEIKTVLASEFGAELKLKRLDVNDNAPLLLAAINGHSEVIKVLINKKYRNNRDIDEAYLWAVRAGKLNAVKELINSGADKYYCDKIGGLKYMPIVWTCMNGRMEVFEYILKFDTKESLKNKDFHLALNWAALGGHYKMVKTLLDFGMNVDSIDDRLNGNTPLMSACEYIGTHEVIEELLIHDCNINMRNDNNKSAIDLAAKRKKYDCIEQILLHSSYKLPEDNILPATYENLKLTMEWAKNNEKLDLLCRLAELGIREENESIIDLAVKLNKYDFIEKLLLQSLYKIPEKDLKLATFENLKLIIEWAKVNEKVDLIYKLEELGVGDKTESAIDLAVKLNKFDFVENIILHYSHKTAVDGVLPATFENLQMIMEWAKNNEKWDLLYKLTELGICEKN